MQSEETKGTTLLPSQKTMKLQHFLNNNYNNKPELPSSILISQLIRQYLNDDDFRILHEGEFVLSSQEYQKKLEAIYEEWTQKTMNKEDIDEFLFYWFDREPELDVGYSLYDDIKQQNKGLEVSAVFNKNRYLIQRPVKTIKTAAQAQRNSTAIKSTIISKQSFTPLELLNQFFVFYSKKQIDPVGSSTFSKYEEYYNSINFAKWMNYVRDMGFLQFKKTLSLQVLKNIFIKYQNKDKCLTFQLFHEAVLKCLEIIYAGNKQTLQSEGYKLIGIKDLKSFQQKFKAMGLLPPILTKKKPKKQFLSRSKINDSESVISKVSIINKPDYKNHFVKSTLLHNKTEKIGRLTDVTNSLQNLKQSQYSKKMKTQQNIKNEPQSLQLSKSVNAEKCLKDLRSNVKVKQNVRLLEQLMQQQQTDPYLKRYNNKESVEKYHCLMNRIDERVQKICNKY